MRKIAYGFGTGTHGDGHVKRKDWAAARFAEEVVPDAGANNSITNASSHTFTFTNATKTGFGTVATSSDEDEYLLRYDFGSLHRDIPFTLGVTGTRGLLLHQAESSKTFSRSNLETQSRSTRGVLRRTARTIT